MCPEGVRNLRNALKKLARKQEEILKLADSLTGRRLQNCDSESRPACPGRG